MSPTTEKVLESAMALSIKERNQLVEPLLTECAQSLARPFGDAWLGEIQRRSAEIDSGTAVLTPWSEMKRRVRANVEGHLDR